MSFISSGGADSVYAFIIPIVLIVVVLKISLICCRIWLYQKVLLIHSSVASYISGLMFFYTETHSLIIHSCSKIALITCCTFT